MNEKKYDADQIYELLKERIIHIKYEPGDVLNEVEVAEEFNVSRTPIRKAFHILNSDKLLSLIPRVGAQVTPIDFKKMKAIFELTRELDPFAARLAVKRISADKIKELEEIMNELQSYNIEKDYQKAIDKDEEFHKIIYSSCGNPWLQEILTYLHYHTERLWHYSEQYFDNIELFSDTLGKILKAIKEQDTENAEKYTREHIDQFVNKIKNEML
ncbi:GntR family transcriptional regulator [Natranaerobius trueperi]|uniref:GntR family transcriptional regulator n=1 Tax=Natranaerobius trueperi TaxID=759412 RepID=A0A226BWJ9_9FIRM|nr:GntR family transcriptional regulator [Natranaerobius trueperi]OWZ83162.1 GntR family transcriptional regulator [Natranaerobius trueperi]